MVVQFSVIPIGSGVHMSGPLARVMRLIDDSGLDYRVGPMGTAVEGSWDQVMRLIKRCHQAMGTRAPRVLTSVTIDDRKGAFGRLEGKVASVVRKAGRPLKT
jgi:uncharacterized protein (TIGR00106 family)